MINQTKYRALIEKAIKIRVFEEKLLDLFAEGKINGTVHTCVGQEIVGPIIADLINDDDFVLSNHRGHGHYIARTGDIHGLLAEIMGKEEGVCSGIGGSQHIFSKNFISNGIQGGMVPISAGIALSYKLKALKNIVAIYIGEGTLGEGIVYETMNICALWNLPVLFILENNGYSQSTSFKQTFHGSIEERMKGFGIGYYKTNTWDIEDLHKTSEKAISTVRKESFPALIEIETYRLNSHSKGDDNRSQTEVSEYREKDLLNIIIDKNKFNAKETLKKLSDEIDIIVSDLEKSSTLSKLKDQNIEELSIQYSDLDFSGERINDLIYASLKERFSLDDRYIMIGEDIEYKTNFTPKPYGGAFKVSKDLSSLFPARVKNTPISEASITGIGIGLAINGMRPIVEIMFGDFMTLTFDQIYNHAAKFRRMSNDKIRVPLVIRTPMGGKRGYGPTHSQSLEKHFLGITDLNVVALNHRITPASIYNSVFNSDNPTLIIENKVLYTRKLNSRSIAGFKIEKTNELFPTIRIRPNTKKAEITVICYGGILEDVETAIELAFDEEEILCEIVCPSIINPINVTPILSSINETNNLLIVEEGTNTAAWGTEVLTQLVQKGGSIKKFERIGNNNIIPCSYSAEANTLPNSNSIFSAIADFFNN